jgi:hypothetical protein
MHAHGQVLAGRLDVQARRGGIADEPQRRARHAEADLHLRTHRPPFDERPQGLHEEGVALVATVPADALAEQAGGHAEPETRGLDFPHRLA